jgi:hypothetical protein
VIAAVRGDNTFLVRDVRHSEVAELRLVRVLDEHAERLVRLFVSCGYAQRLRLRPGLPVRAGLRLLTA